MAAKTLLHTIMVLSPLTLLLKFLLKSLGVATMPLGEPSFHNILHGLNLLGYIDGTHPCPPDTIIAGEQVIPNPAQ